MAAQLYGHHSHRPQRPLSAGYGIALLWRFYHLMHIVGLARDQRGHRFYLTKNSHSRDRKYEGYVYLSKPYVLLHGIAVMVNKNALPDDIRDRLGL